MKLVNTLDWPDRFIRRMVSWCCRELGLPVRYIREAQFRNTSNAWGGLCYGRRIGVRVGNASHFPCKSKRHRNGLQIELADRTETLVYITAHELAHSANRRDRAAGRRGGWGGTEQYTDTLALKVLEAFRANRPALLAAWGDGPEAAPATPVTPPRMAAVIEQREAKARAAMERWERKLKLAKTKLAKYRAKVKYYERRAANRGPAKP